MSLVWDSGKEEEKRKKRAEILSALKSALKNREKNPNIEASRITSEEMKSVADKLRSLQPKTKLEAVKVPEDDLNKSYKYFAEKAQHFHNMMTLNKSEDSYSKWQALRDKYVEVGLEKLKKAQYAKTEPVEERKKQNLLRKREEKNKEIVGKQLRTDAEDVIKKKSGHDPGKGISSENPKKTLRSVNKVDAGKSVNPKPKQR